jgi:hypothetical protein
MSPLGRSSRQTIEVPHAFKLPRYGVLGCLDLRSSSSGRRYMRLSVPVKKNISSAGLVDSGPVGGEAVQNSTVVSICGDFWAARSEPPSDCVQDEL